MVRKVRIIDVPALKKAIQNLFERLGSLFNVSNAEWYSLLKEEIRHSLASDGIIANRKELLDVLENNQPSHPKAAAISGYFEAARTMYGYAHHQFKENEFALRMSDIKQIHTLLMRQAGQGSDFRQNNVDETMAPFKPVNMFYVRGEMEKLVKWFNESSKNKIYDELTLSVMAYARFMKIYPFSDGNNRAGRILLNYVLIGQGLINTAIKEIPVEGLDTPNQEAFAPLVQMIGASIKKAISRLESAQLADSDTEAVLPLRHLAKMYDYSQDYLRNLINRGHVNAFKKGKLWYVKVEDLKRYINAQNKN